ncbi:putative RNA helicase SDE3 [Diplonema papillatum]|nr:putative RNA helicase SDE3 [Diplonema papillatum]
MKAFTTPKKDGRTARLVLDARPLNDAMRRPPSMDLPRLRDFIAEVERHRFAMQCDGVSYFYQFPVDASISRYFGIGMKGCDMLLNVLCMGWSWAPCIAQRASNVLVRDLGLAWVDNFLVLGGTLDEAERNVAVFRKRAQAARVEVRAEGDDALWQVRSRFVCVGVEFDLAAETQRHRLDPAWAERWVDGSGMTAVLSGRATARQFAEVFGGAVWATDILAVPRCHFAALLSFAGRLGGRMVGAAAPVWDEVVDVPPSARRELGALRKIVRENPWVVGGVPEDTGSVLWTDASSRAWAALLEAEGRFVDGRQGVFAGPDADAHINLKEMLAFAEGVVRLCWAPGAQRCRIDNAAVVGAVAKGSSSSASRGGRTRGKALKKDTKPDRKRTHADPAQLRPEGERSVRTARRRPVERMRVSLDQQAMPAQQWLLTTDGHYFPPGQGAAVQQQQQQQLAYVQVPVQQSQQQQQQQPAVQLMVVGNVPPGAVFVLPNGTHVMSQGAAPVAQMHNMHTVSVPQQQQQQQPQQQQHHRFGQNGSQQQYVVLQQGAAPGQAYFSPGAADAGRGAGGQQRIKAGGNHHHPYNPSQQQTHHQQHQHQQHHPGGGSSAAALQGFSATKPCAIRSDYVPQLPPPYSVLCLSQMLSENERGVSVSLASNCSPRITATVTNTNRSAVELVDVCIIGEDSNPPFRVKDSLGVQQPGVSIAIPAGCKYDVEVLLCAEKEGVFKAWAVFRFKIRRTYFLISKKCMALQTLPPAKDPPAKAAAPPSPKAPETLDAAEQACTRSNSASELSTQSAGSSSNGLSSSVSTAATRLPVEEAAKRDAARGVAADRCASPAAAQPPPLAARLAASRLNAAASTFVPSALKRAFDEPAREVIQATPPAIPPSYSNRAWTQALDSKAAPVADAAFFDRRALAAFPVLSEPLSAANYVRRFEALLWVEEARMTEEIKSFDLYHTRLAFAPAGGEAADGGPCDNVRLLLDIPGLHEQRPGLLYGDMVWVKDSKDPAREWTAYIEDTHANRPAAGGAVPPGPVSAVLLTINASFAEEYPSLAGAAFHVRFGIRRTKLRRMHAALAMVAAAGAAGTGVRLFPGPSQFPPPEVAGAAAFDFFDENLNAEQTKAVGDIVRRTGWLGAANPYVIFGPPGTGKTLTIIEATKQVLSHVPGARILIAAPSDSAADVVCSRLASWCRPVRDTCRHRTYACDGAKVGGSPYCSTHLCPECKGDRSGAADVNCARHTAAWKCSERPEAPAMLRFYSYQRNVLHVPIGEVIPFTLPDNGLYGICDFDTLRTLSIIVCTCTSAGTLYEYGLPRGSFSHIFIDEAGQAMEPETAIPLVFADEKTSTVFAGDYMQLGPTVRAPICRELGLDVSLLQRLHQRYCGDPGSFERCYQVLTKQYRSHPALMKTSSDLFYNGILRPCGSESVTHSLVGWADLPNPEFPLLFCGVAGDDEKGRDTHSFYNLAEVRGVCQIVKRLTQATGIAPRDIGVIAPFRVQVHCLRHALRNGGFGGVRVGTVEDYQGQESKVVILSTVRSSAKWLKSDQEQGVGMHFNSRKFNVSISRAQALMAVVGNAELLWRDPNWRSFISHCIANAAYIGSPTPEQLRESRVSSFIPSSERAVNLSDAQLTPTEDGAFSTEALQSILCSLQLSSTAPTSDAKWGDDV